MIYTVNNSVVVTGNSVGTCNNIQDVQSNIEKDHTQNTKDATPQRPPCIEIVTDASVGAVNVDDEVSVISGRMDLEMPVISVQIASPVVTSPTEKEGTLCSAMEKYAHAWTGNFDFEEADGNGEIDADDGKKSGVIYQQGHQYMDVDDACDAEDRPLSPTDYTLEDESESNQVDSQDVYYPMMLDCRAPSPSEFSLLTESAEENDLRRLTHNAIPDDVFAIPDPSPSSAEVNMYLAMHYDQVARSHHADTANSSVLMPGSNMMNLTYDCYQSIMLCR